MAVNWRKLKTEYVTGLEGYRALATKHGVSFAALSKTASKEGWAAARRQYRDKVSTETADAMCARACAREVDRLERLKTAADKVAERIEQVFEDGEQFNRHIVSRSVGGGESFAEERVFRKVDTRAIRDLTAALKDMTATMRNLYGLPTVQERTAMDIAAARLVVEQKKAEQADAGGDREIVVRFEGDGDGWSG